MKVSQADILVLPGLDGGQRGHWYDRWSDKLKSARRVEQKSWHEPVLDDWIWQIVRAVEQAPLPVVLVGHSLGALAAAHAAPRFPHQKVAGGYLVAPPDIETLIARHPARQKIAAGFKPAPTAPLPFPSILVASRNDPYCPFAKAEDMSFAWGSKLESAGESGHINADNGQGPWPEGLLSFANFMARL